ncbi:MAG TPA: hypothetical protein VF482_11375 [Trebonia sp.]
MSASPDMPAPAPPRHATPDFAQFPRPDLLTMMALMSRRSRSRFMSVV